MLDAARTRTARMAPSALTFGVLACLFAGALLVVDALFVHTELGQRLDNAALLGRSGVPDDLVANAWSILDTISMTLLLGAVAIIGAIGLVRRRLAQAAAAALVLVGANVTTQVLKRIVLTRPELVDDGVKAYNSLPSGHATVALSVAAALVLVMPSDRRSVVGIAGAGYAAAVGVATLVAGWHRPSDAVAAWLVVGTWTSAAAALLAMQRRGRPDGTDRTGPDRLEVLLWVGAVAALLGTLVVGVALGVVVGAADGSEIAGLGARSLAFLAAAGGITASAAGVMATLVTGVRPIATS